VLGIKFRPGSDVVSQPAHFNLPDGHLIRPITWPWYGDQLNSLKTLLGLRSS
jgi:hypothetical protein